MQAFGDIDLDILRGWAERRDPALRQEHALPPLARLVPLESGIVETLHGPDVLVGRYHPQYGPVDVILRELEDHQNYRLGAPHLHLTLSDDGVWTLRTLSPGARTLVGEDELEAPNQPHPLDHGDVVTLGCVRYRFETSGLALGEWEEARARLLDEAGGPALFLCRRGGPCGPRAALDEAHPLVVGRSFPPPGAVPAGSAWDGRAQPDWDLAGLYEEERKFIAFEHLRLESIGGVWHAEPLAARRRTFVNRIDIIDVTPLSLGDELALGSVVFYLHQPAPGARPARKAIEPPAVVDWQEGSSPILDEADAAKPEDGE